MSDPNLLNSSLDTPEPSVDAEASWSDEPAPRHRRRWPWVVLIVVLLLAIVGTPLAWHVWQLGSEARTAKQALDRVRVSLQAADINGATLALGDAKTSLDQIKVELSGIGNWRYVPWIGTQIRALEDVQRTGSLAIDGAEKLLSVASTMKDAFESAGILTEANGIAPQRSFKSLSREEKQQILGRLYGLLPDIRLARDKIVLAEQAWEQIPQDQIAAPLRNALAPIAQNLPKIKEEMETSVSLMEVMIPLMGYPTEKQYLVLLQNNDELRPTGGFIGNVGTLRVDSADIEELKFEDVYAVDNLVIGKLKETPPDILRRELDLNTLYRRDANWSPDVPQSMAHIMDLDARERALAGLPPLRLDGIIALEPDLFSQLLRLTGPITVEGKQFTADNFFDQIQYDVEQGFLQNGIPVSQRKEIVAKVGQTLVSNLLSLPSSRWGDLLTIAKDAFQKKNIMIYAKDPSLQALLDAKDWSGRTHSSPDDYLWVIDANLAARKTDGVMQKDIYYTLDLSNPKQPMATVRLVYKNTNRIMDWRYTRYRSYTRVYVPEGSELISSKGAMLTDKSKAGGRVIPGTVDVSKDLGKTVFGAFWAVEPGETGELTFNYRLPENAIQSLTQNLYHLYLQKQPGADQQVHLDINFYRPVQTATPPEAENKFGDNRYQWDTSMTTDKEVQVQLK